MNLYILLILLLQCHDAFSLDSIIKLISANAEILRQGSRYLRDQVFDTTTFLQQYDFIIVGGGTAGCIVANRLTENSQHTVLLLEAGGDENYLLTIPAIVSYFFSTEIVNKYNGIDENACLSYTNRRCKFPRGRVLGGSSVINGMFFTRGNRKDYDRYLEMGNYGWGYEDVLPYFKKLENLQIPEYINKFRGTNGPVPINLTPYETPLGSSFLETLQDLGYDSIDYNGELQTGYSKVQCNIMNGSRYSMNRAYLMPIKYRPNLHVAKNAFVTKLLINPITKNTEGVEFIKNNKKYQIHVKKEVILSAGSFGTPQILMLSGIGPEDHLNELNIPVIQNLKVGYNLQDHVGFTGLLFLIDQPLSLNFRRVINNLPDVSIDYYKSQNGPLTTVLGTEGISLINTDLNNDTAYPDIEFFFASSGVTQEPLAYSVLGLRKEVYDIAYKDVEKLSAFSILPVLLKPRSYGRLTLKSRNPYQHPNILANYFNDDLDVEILVKGIKLAIQAGESKEFKKYGSRLHKITLPECDYEFNSDDFWRCAVRHLTLVLHHFVGTAKMGPESDPDAVVDPELRVYGIKGLRVVDASILPFVPNAHTAAPAMMIGEKGSDLIKITWGK